MFAKTSIKATAAAGLALLVTQVQARIWAGPVDMIEACHQQYGPNWDAKLNGKSAFDWVCRKQGSGETGSINVDAYCSDKYHDGAYADAQGGGAYDWGCYWR